jgi:hypothetical protein
MTLVRDMNPNYPMAYLFTTANSHFIFSRLMSKYVISLQTYNAPLLNKWCLHFIATNYDLFEREEDFKTIWSENEEYMKGSRWPTQTHLQVLNSYKEKSTKEMIVGEISRRRFSNKCSCCIM